MLSISIGILLVWVLAIGANALRAMARPVSPWAWDPLPPKRRGPWINRHPLRAGSAVRFIRGPTSFRIGTRPRPGTGRRWLEAESLVVP